MATFSLPEHERNLRSDEELKFSYSGRLTYLSHSTGVFVRIMFLSGGCAYFSGTMADGVRYGFRFSCSVLICVKDV